MPNSNRKVFVSFILLISILHFPFSAKSQVRPIYDYGAVGLGQLLKRLNTTKSVMMIGAHPDDEDSALLAYLARGENARTAYLSLTRGDGGQNIIGAELFESLGVIRTEELLQARKLDGAEQYFTRAFDYGFSKTLAEAKAKWDEKIILCDTVRAIRLFRPLVVISRFSGTPADGHGQHQYAGYISPLAVKAAADPAQCKDSGAAWQVLKFYVEQGFRSTDEPTLRINTGAYDFLLGRGYAEIAAEGRSLHRTQEQGGLELKGDRFSGLNLIESKVPQVENEKSVFDGIDTSLKAISRIAGFGADFKKYDTTALGELSERVLREYQAGEPQKIISLLVEDLQNVRQILGTPFCTSASNSGRDDCDQFPIEQRRAAEHLFALAQFKNAELQEAIVRAAGIRIDVLANKETVAPGEQFSAAARVYIPKSANAKVQAIDLFEKPNNWSIGKTDAPPESGANFRTEIADAAVNFNITIGKEENRNIYTQPYWLEKPRRAALFDWRDAANNQNLPFAVAPARISVIFEIGGTTVSAVSPIEYRYADGVRGEIRRELNIVPQVSLKLDQDLLIVPQSDKAQIRKIVLNIENNSSDEISGEAKLNVPANIKISPETARFDLKNKGAKTAAEFAVTIPADYKTGDFTVGAAASANGQTFNQTMHIVAYPHIQTHRFYTDARAKVEVLDLKAAPVKVGYITGSGDDVPEAIRQMNLPVDLLSEKDLSSGDLQQYDVIVVGIRAYNVRRDLTANNQKVLDYVKNGGTLIVQYQRPDYTANNFPPFPASQTDTQKTTAGTTARVVDETAKVTILQPQNPVFNFPNKISDADFANWVQERDLYNFTTFDQNYTPLLESHDVNEQENKGGMVFAKLGKGNYIYTSYSFFRQLPAGVPGAFRLFANLLSLPKK